MNKKKLKTAIKIEPVKQQHQQLSNNCSGQKMRCTKGHIKLLCVRLRVALFKYERALCVCTLFKQIHATLMPLFQNDSFFLCQSLPKIQTNKKWFCTAKSFALQAVSAWSITRCTNDVVDSLFPLLFLVRAIFTLYNASAEQQKGIKTFTANLNGI